MSEFFWNTITENAKFVLNGFRKVRSANTSTWQAVKEYFILQAKQIGQDWLKYNSGEKNA